MSASKEQIKESVPYTFIFFNVIVLCTMTMGIMCTANLHGQEIDPDKLVATMYQNFWPLGGALLTLAVFATGMSTIDSILLTISSIVTHDIAVKGFGKVISKKREFVIARSIAMLFLVIVCFFAMSETGRGAIAPLVTLGASLATLFLWPLLGIFCFSKVRNVGIMATMLIGFFAILLDLITNFTDALPIGPATLAFCCSAVIFFLMLALCVSKDTETRKEEYEKICSSI
jgi:Na+/proline symporter